MTTTTPAVRFSLFQAMLMMFVAAGVSYVNVCHFDPIGAITDGVVLGAIAAQCFERFANSVKDELA
jgi:hypothetical protein